MLLYLKLLLSSVSVLKFISCETFASLKYSHPISNFSSQSIRYVHDAIDWNHFDNMLSNILVPRVVGTPGHEKVFEFIVNELKKSNFNVEVDEFKGKTPLGVLKFRNVIGTLNPDAERHLVLACHYDSKYFEGEVFLAAVDSAVPCAMMLNLAKFLQNQQFASSDVTLKLIFFDGEEAFVNWGPNDSIYGAKHLAKKYENNLATTRSGERVNELEKMDVLVLLDLLGGPNPTFYNYFDDSKKWYLQMYHCEQKLRKRGLLKSNHHYFRKQSRYGGVEDDHIPFLQRGVPILHVIPIPFPDVWHTLNDNRENLDDRAIKDMSLILRLFVAQYLNMSV